MPAPLAFEEWGIQLRVGVGLAVALVQSRALSLVQRAEARYGA